MFDLGEIMATPPMQRDIGESFMFAPMPMPMYGMGMGMYGGYCGSNCMIPKVAKSLPEDKYEKNQAKNASEFGTAKKIITGTLVAAASVYCLRKLPIRSSLKAVKSAVNWVCGWAKYGCQKAATFFKGLNIPKAPTP